ncbi:uncharacterized protein ARB_05926 [Trichophyton benhamiae CBS 112371]|uniref:Uncharacterized protein n=2 Tax=Trichophyton TaxID=5550 RepID=D4ANV9_ARTBC|nr:uncharacterized protein ARB_05926 [Trichophyton benhamiae CBS 112371]XP_003025712.1 uncharacterized protein TRV_00126 [Trichophyton verrucosum HKI 0517]EFE34970.1 hypothetical protein ARB_05926 [Trichophyton benhamiae CBS 112371]EFE45101.1 hypothetical protein TRV_00126 [Trichophyton verrucosum HKI 0517]
MESEKKPAATTARTSARTRKPTSKAREAELNRVTKPKARPRKRAVKKDATAPKGSKQEPEKSQPKLESPEPVKPDTGKEAAIPTILVTDETGRITRLPQTPPRLSKEDEQAVAILLELAAAAMAPDFIPEVEVDLVAYSHQFYSQFPTAAEATTMGRLADPSELSCPDLPRPHTDNQGWTHTGRVNEHGEEYIVIPPSFARWSPAEPTDPSPAMEA